MKRTITDEVLARVMTLKGVPASDLYTLRHHASLEHDNITAAAIHFEFGCRHRATEANHNYGPNSCEGCGATQTECDRAAKSCTQCGNKVESNSLR